MTIASVPQYLQAKVLETYNHVWRYGGAKDGMLRDSTLSLDLRRQLADCLYGDALRKVPIFQGITENSLKSLAQKIEMRLYTPGDLLMTAGEVGVELFVIHTGLVQPLTTTGE